MRAARLIYAIWRIPSHTTLTSPPKRVKRKKSPGASLRTELLTNNKMGNT